MPFENHNVFNVFFRESRQARKFGGHPAQIAYHFARRVFTLRVGPIRKGEPLVELRRFPQLWLQGKKQARHGRREATRNASR